MQLVAFGVRADLSVAVPIIPCLVAAVAVQRSGTEGRADRAGAGEAMPPELSPLNEMQLVVTYFIVLWLMFGGRRLRKK